MTFPVKFPRGKDGLSLLVVLLLALGLRAAFFVERSASPDLRHPTIDAGFHDDWAHTLAFGEQRSSEWRPVHLSDPHFADTPYLRPPAFPYLLAGVYLVTGGSHLAAIGVQMLLGLLSVALLWGLLRRVAGRGAAVVGALLLGTHWAPLYFEGELHATALLILLQLCMATALVRHVETGARRWLLGAAVALGLATLTRPNALLYLPAAVGWLAWVGHRRGVRWGRSAGLLSVGVLLTLAPATLRNGLVSGQWVPVTTNFGINFYLGNHAGADGLIRDEAGVASFKTCYDYPSLMLHLQSELGPSPNHEAVSTWFSDRAWDWIFSEPADAFALTWRKLRWFLGPMEVGHNKEVALERKASPLLRWLPMSFTWMLGLAVFGLLAHAAQRTVGKGDGDETEGTRHELAVLVLILLLAYILSLLPFFAAARYRVPALPWLALLASLALPARRAGTARLVAAAVGALLLSLLTLWNAPQVSQSGEKWHVERAIAYSMDDQLERAREELELALEANPGSVRALYELALLEHKDGNVARARQLYEQVLRTEPTHHLALFNVGTIQRDQGDLKGAIERFIAAEAAQPTFATAPFNQGLLHLQMGRFRRAAECLERAVNLDLPSTRLLDQTLQLLDRASAAAREMGRDAAPLEALAETLRRRRSPSVPR